MKISEFTEGKNPLFKINKFLDDKKRREEYARKLQQQRDAEDKEEVSESLPIDEDENDLLYKVGRGITRLMKGDPNWEPDLPPTPQGDWSGDQYKDAQGNPPSDAAIRKMDQLTRDYADAAGISYADALAMRDNPSGEAGDWAQGPGYDNSKLRKAGSNMHYAGGRGESTMGDVHDFNQRGNRAAQRAADELRREIPNFDQLDTGTQNQIRRKRAELGRKDSADRLLKRGKYATQNTAPTQPKTPQTVWATGNDEAFPNPFESKEQQPGKVKHSVKESGRNYNPDSETYKGSKNRIPNSKSISKKDITVKGKQVDFPDGAYDATQFDDVSKKEMEKNIRDVLDTLTKTEQTVLKARFGIEPFNREYNLKEIGDALGVGPERIRQIEAKALRKLKHPSRSRKVRSYIGEDMGNIPPLADLIIMAVLAKTSVDVLMGAFKVALKTGKGLKKLNALRRKVTAMGQRAADYAMPNESQIFEGASNAVLIALLGEELSRDELIAKLSSNKETKFYLAALDALKRMVASKGDEQSVAGYIFDIKRAFKDIDAKKLEDMYYADQ